MQTEVRRRRPPRVFAVILILIGLMLAVGGVRLVSLGGSFYYVLAGLAVLASGVLLWRRDRRGSLLYGLLLIATLLWSFYEVGANLWALAPRLLALLVIGAWFLTPWVRRSLHSPAEPPPLFGRRAGTAALSGIVVVGVTIVVIGARASIPAHQSKPPTVTSAQQPDAQPPAQPPVTSGADWQNYGNTTAGTRYMRVDQITPDNVGRLEKIWHVRTQQAGWFKVTPIQIGDLLYMCTCVNVRTPLMPRRASAAGSSTESKAGRRSVTSERVSRCELLQGARSTPATASSGSSWVRRTHACSRSTRRPGNVVLASAATARSAC